MSAWWQGLASRDRSVLIAGALIIAVTLLWAWGWYPLAQSRDRLRRDVATAEADLAWMRGAAQQVQQQGAGTATALERGGRSLLALADWTAREAGLGPVLKRVEPSGTGRVSVWFEAAGFDALAQWLESLGAGYGVGVDELSVDRVEGVGAVNARVTLVEAPG